jgi:predicted O-linked N-acetylglucosamine transferase (SPINDLY family)
MATLSEALATAQQHHAAGRLQEAEAIYRQILAVEPNQADALHLLGVIAHQVGQHALAAEYIERALGLVDNNAGFHNSLGEVHRACHRLPEAVACYRRALALLPDRAETHNNLGIALKDLGRLEEAVACYRRALELNPDYAFAHNNLGNALLAQGKLDEAAACFRRALELKPDYPHAYNSLGNVLKTQGELDEAIACYRQAVRLRPAFPEAHSNLLTTLLFHPDYNAQALYEDHRRWNRQHAEPLTGFIQPHPNDHSPERRLRIGYVSPDFTFHPVGRFLLPLLANHDRASFEVFCYASVEKPDGGTAQCRRHADVWRDVGFCTDEELATTIRHDQIDILVDLSMHSRGNRLLLFARKPAPVQVTYLAYCGTTGLDAIDYRLSDPYLDPPGQDEGRYVERTVRLPETYWCYQPAADAPLPNDLPALSTGQVTFGCLNSFTKVTARALAAWGRLLTALPQSRLILHACPGSHRGRVLTYFATQTIGADRVEFTDFLPAKAFFQVYHRVDIGLDPFPFGGGTTTCDALWMGVPVVSLAGQTAVGRAGLSILSNVGLQNLVAPDVDQYVNIAVELARDLPRLRELRATMRRRMQASPLMDAPRFARHVEAAYRDIWKRWCDSPSRTA